MFMHALEGFFFYLNHLFVDAFDATNYLMELKSHIMPDFALLDKVPESTRGRFCEIESPDAPVLISEQLLSNYKCKTFRGLQNIPESSRMRFRG